jgi:bifunctional UDP-N-acetylglucosamine pyrophosphorylase/glucosamine-1-phosphate N-acetyltransferase
VVVTNLHAVVLAAGLGTRMKSKIHKVLHPVCGQPMIRYVVDGLRTAGIGRIIVVVGKWAEQVREYLGDAVEYAVQEEPLGTAHAVLQAEPLLAGASGTTMVVNGDSPLVRPETYSRMVACHRDKAAAATVLTAMLDNPFGYGRVIRSYDGEVHRIVEQKDASSEELAIREVNGGAYCFDNGVLFEALRQIRNHNAQGEYYLTDCIDVIRKGGKKVQAFVAQDPREILGVNDRVQLAEVNRILRERILEEHMRNGVTIVDPQSTYLDATVVIEQDVILYPGVFLQGQCHIKEGAMIGPQTRLLDTVVGVGSIVEHSVVLGAAIGDGVKVGPFAYLRPGSKIGNHAKIGDFVEIKNAVIGRGAKISHLAYVGDADVGDDTNLGCGVITVNYDGVKKHRTVIGAGSFIGCNVNLVAPLTIGNDVYIAAGSTITRDVPEGALAISRERRQVIKEGYTARLRSQFAARSGKSED